MTKFLYVLLAILSALVTVWCSFSWTLSLAVFLGLSLLLFLLQLREEGGGVRVRQQDGVKWLDDNDISVKIKHKDNNSKADQGDKIYHGTPAYFKRKTVNRNRNHSETLGSDSEDEDILGSVSTSNPRTTTITSIMSSIEKSISNNRLLSLFSVFNKKSNGENNRPGSSPGRLNVNNKDDKQNGRQALRGNRRRMAVGGNDRTTTTNASYMSPPLSGSKISRLNNSQIIGSPLSFPSRGRITRYQNVRTLKNTSSPHEQRGRFSSSVLPSSPHLSNSPLPRFHRTACESPDRPSINPVGFTPHALQRPEVCYPSTSSPGVLPHVRLEKRIKIPLVESNINKMRSPVTVRIAPPETGAIHSPKFTSLKHNLDFSMTPDTSDVLSALREGTRKRTNIAGSDEESNFESNNTAKRRRQESNHSTASSSSMPSLPDFLPDLSMCNFAPSYMSPTSHYMVPSSSSLPPSSLATSSGSIATPSLGVMTGTSSINTGIKRPGAPCVHLSQAENSPNSKRLRQEMKNNPILSSLSSSRRLRLQQKESVKRKIPDSSDLQNSLASKENQKTHPSDNQQFEKPASKASKLSRSLTETANSDNDTSQPSVSTSTDYQSEDIQVITSSSESTTDLRNRRKNLSFASPGINLNRLSYANVYATKQDYENDRKAEQERVEKMLDRIATGKKAPDADLLSENNVVESCEEPTKTTSSVLTCPSLTISSSPRASTCTTATTSLLVSSTTASLTSSSSSSLPAKETSAKSSSATTDSASSPVVSLSTLSSATTTTAAGSLSSTQTPLTNTLSSLLQSTPSTSPLVTPSSKTTTISVPPTTSTTTDPSRMKPIIGSTASNPVSISTTPVTAFQPTFGSPTLTSAQSPSKGGFQFDLKTSSTTLTPSSIPSTTSIAATSLTTSSFSPGTFSTASTTPALTSTSPSFTFGASIATPQASITPGTSATTESVFSSPKKESPKTGGFLFNLVNPEATPTSSTSQPTDTQKLSSPLATPKTLVSSKSSSSFFALTGSSPSQSLATPTSTSSTLETAPSAAAPTTATSVAPPTGVFTFGKSTPPASLSQSPASGTSNPSTGMFSFKSNDASKTSSTSTSVSTSSPAGIFAFQGASNSTPAVSGPASSETGFNFGASGANTGLQAFGSSGKAPPAFGATTSAISFGSVSSKLGTTLASSSSPFGAASTTTPAFGATTTVTTPAFGAASTSAPAFGATSTTTPAFGATATSTPAFGATATSTPAFGATATSTPAFGATATTTPAFGATATTTPAFGATATTTPAFGATATTTPAFGATATTTPPFGATATTTPAFGATATSTQKFGTASPSTAAFGAATTSAAMPAFGSSTPAFGATASAASPLFGSANKPKTAFGTTTSPFGGSTTAFGTLSGTNTLFGASGNPSSQANPSSATSFQFDSSSNTARTTSAPSTGFNFSFNSTPATASNTFNFGSTAGSSTSTATGTTATTTATSTSGSTSIFGQASSTFGGFSSAGQVGQKSIFGSPSTNQSGFNFSGSSTNQTSNVFGQTGQQPQSSIFQSNDPSQPQQQSSKPFTFGQGTPSFGQSSTFSSPQSSSSSSTFGTFGAKPNVFSTPTNNSEKPPEIFGSSPVSVANANPTSQAKPVFGQVSSQPFGAAGTTPTNTGNTGLFGTPPMGQASTPAGGSSTPGIFTFGQSPSTSTQQQQPQATAAPATPNQGFDFSASIGGTAQFNFGQVASPSKPPMFNMGSGSTAPKMRSFYPKARRRGAKK